MQAVTIVPVSFGRHRAYAVDARYSLADGSSGCAGVGGLTASEAHAQYARTLARLRHCPRELRSIRELAWLVYDERPAPHSRL